MWPSPAEDAPHRAGDLCLLCRLHRRYHHGGGTTTNSWGQPVSAAAAGSGFVITNDGYILTNYHVIDGAQSIKVAFVDGTTYDAVLVGGEEENDIAVLKIDATGLTPVIIGDSDNIKVGEQVVAIGNPLGELTYSKTQGIISAKDRSITMQNGEVMNMLQTDTAINSGNSGGPLFDMYGQVIGITSAKLSSSSSTSEATIEGLGFAIPINDIKDMVQDIIAHGYVTGKAYMGITVTTVPERRCPALRHEPGRTGQSVDEFCAAKAGLRRGYHHRHRWHHGPPPLNWWRPRRSIRRATPLPWVDRSGESLQRPSPSTRTRLSAVLPRRRPLRKGGQQEQQQSQQGSSDFFWPFGGLSPGSIDRSREEFKTAVPAHSAPGHVLRFTGGCPAWCRDQEGKDAVLLLIQLEHGHEGLGDLHSPQAPHFSFSCPREGVAFPGDPIPISFARAGESALRQGQAEPGRYAALCAPPRAARPRKAKENAAVTPRPSLSTAINASVGICTVPRLRIFFLPSFCFSSSFFFG